MRRLLYFAAIVKLLESPGKAGGLPKGNYRHAVGFEILQDLMLEGTEGFALFLMLIASPMLVEAILPRISIEHLSQRIHQLCVFVGGC